MHLPEKQNHLVSCLKLTDLTVTDVANNVSLEEYKKQYSKVFLCTHTRAIRRLPLTPSLIPSPSPFPIQLNLEYHIGILRIILALYNLHVTQLPQTFKFLTNINLAIWSSIIFLQSRAKKNDMADSPTTVQSF